MKGARKSKSNPGLIQAEELGKCPCGGSISGNDTAMIHSLPMCKEFEAMDVLEYARWVNKQRRAERAKHQN